MSSTVRTAESADCHDPSLAVNPAGRAVVVADCGSGTTQMRAGSSIGGGAWGSTVEVPGSGSGEQPRVVLDDSGNALLVWGSGGAVKSSYRTQGAGSSWSASPETVSPATAGEDEALQPQVAISPTGMAWAVWRHQRNQSLGDPVATVEAMRKHGSSAWEAPTLKILSAPMSANPVSIGEPQIRWNANGAIDGERVVVWETQSGANTVLDKRSGGGGDFGGWNESIQIASDAERTVEEPQVALDGQGRATAVWRTFKNPPGVFGVAASTTPDLIGSWATPTPFATTVNLEVRPQVATDPGGDATAVWASAGTIAAASHPPGGALGSPVTITGGSSALGDEPHVAMDNNGDAVVVWASGAHVEVGVNDVTPPSLVVFGGGAAEVGTPLSMSARATDVWSSPIVHWDFGDGTGVDGEEVSHTYSDAGVKTVTTSSTDTAGNVGGSVIATIEVTRKPGDRPPDSPPRSPRHVTLGIAVPKQRWKAIDKARAIKLRCSLDTSGACKATAAVSRSVAAHLGLIHFGPKGSGSAKPVQIGVGSVHIDHAGHALALEIHLAGKARAAIDAAKQNVPVTLAVTGSASGQVSTSLTRKLTIARP